MKRVLRRVRGMMIGVGLVAALGFSAGCGDDDDGGGGGSADCSECSGDTADSCNETYDDCREAGGGHDDCDTVAQVVCSFGGGFGDAGAP